MCDVAALGDLIIRKVFPDLVLSCAWIEALSLKDIQSCSLHVLVLEEVELAVAVVSWYPQAVVEFVHALLVWRVWWVDSHFHQILPDSAWVCLVFALTVEHNLWSYDLHCEPLEAIVGAHEQDAAPMLRTLRHEASMFKRALDVQLLIEGWADSLIACCLVGRLLLWELLWKLPAFECTTEGVKSVWSSVQILEDNIALLFLLIWWAAGDLAL